MIPVICSSIVSGTAGRGVASIALLDISRHATIAQVPEQLNPGYPSASTMSQVNVLFVNPSIGDDKAGNGGESNPLKTITQALKLAKPNTTITLAQGTYSSKTGEKFPLMLKAGIAIEGDPRNQGRGVVIEGGGDYLSRSFGGQNVAIVSANQTKLTGVTVINPNPRGYGLWIESSNGMIVENTFAGSTQDGIAVTGNSAPIIRNNFFYQNGANGVTISGSAQPEIQGNVFQQTGFGINIAQKSKPLILNNQIQDNRTGIIVQAEARPVLRGNVIQDNKEDGLVVLAQALPDLGSTSEPGNNRFENNARYDINASATKQVLYIYGNSFANNRISGKVETAAVTALNSQVSQSTTLPRNNDKTINFFALPNRTQEDRRSTGADSSVLERVLNRQLLPLVPAQSPLSQRPTNQQPLMTSGGKFPVPSTLRGDRTLPTTAASPGIPAPQTIEFVAPQTVSNPIAPAPVQTTSSLAPSLPRLQSAPVGDAALLPVSSPKTPVTELPVPPAATTAYSGSSQIDLRYRVLVETESEREEDLVKFLAPGAFHTVWQGRGVMQVGVFSSRYNADSIMRILNNNGLKAMIEPIN